MVKLSFIIFCLFVLTLASQASELKTIKVGEVTREFAERVPEKCKNQNCALVFVFHGGGGNPTQVEDHVQFTPLSNREGFIVVYPKGVSKQWNDGRNPPVNDADDLAFVDALLKDLEGRLKIDKKRIFATGISNGGFMSFLLACERADVFAAVAPVAANLTIGRLDACKPSQAVSLLNIVGSDDATVPFKGGRVKVFLGFKNRGSVLSSEETLKMWLKIDGCADKAQLTKTDNISTDKTSIEDSRYTEGCKAGSEVRRMVVVGGGHAWPGHKPNHILFSGAKVTSEEIDATDVIWKFFATHARP